MIFGVGVANGEMRDVNNQHLVRAPTSFPHSAKPADEDDMRAEATDIHSSHLHTCEQYLCPCHIHRVARSCFSTASYSTKEVGCLCEAIVAAASNINRSQRIPATWCGRIS